MIQTINSNLRKIPAWTIYLTGAIWAAWLFYQGVTGALGREPVNALERAYGEIALQLMILGLLVTPVRRWIGLNLLKFRRAIGVTAFFFVLAHLLVFVVLDVQSLERAWTEIVKRPYVTVGMASFVLMVPLAVTSNNRSVRKMGAAAWQRLHKLTYVAALLGGIHYVWLSKGIHFESLAYLVVIGAVLATRLVGKPAFRKQN